MPQSPFVKIAGLNVFLYMSIECEALIECHSEALEFHSKLNVGTGDSNTRSLLTFLSLTTRTK